jgi:hypothetical protein
MAVAKGATLPKERMLDAVNATQHALDVFAVWAGIKASSNLDGLHAVDATQIELAAWQADRFASAPTSECHMALGVIEELGEAFDEDAGPEDSVDALGDVMIYASQLCTLYRLAVRPVIELAETYVKRNGCHNHAAAIAGNLAHVVLKHSQGIRGLGPLEAFRPRLVDALALMIAKSIEDCTIGHELVIDAAGVFCVVAREVMERKAGDAMIPTGTNAELVTAGPVVTAEERKAAALEQLQDGAEMLEKAVAAEPGDFRIERDRYGQPIAVDE